MICKENIINKTHNSFEMSFGKKGPVAFISLAIHGDMGFGNDVNRERRRKWLINNNIEPKHSASVNLIHSKTVIEASNPDAGLEVEADGICAPFPYKKEATRSLVITVADCMPIFLWDSGTGAIGLLHSGWMGTGILINAVKLMKALYGSKVKDIKTILGPCIGPCCYTVDESRAVFFEQEFGRSSVIREAGKPRLDLRAANTSIAKKLGLGLIINEEYCTCCNPIFGSFRRQGPKVFTRMAAVIAYP